MFPALERLIEASECRTQKELAEFLGVKPPAVAAARRRKAIPSSWLITSLRMRGVNPDWVLTGNGPRFLAPAEPGWHKGNGRQSQGTHTSSQSEGDLGRYTGKQLVDELMRRMCSS